MLTVGKSKEIKTIWTQTRRPESKRDNDSHKNVSFSYKQFYGTHVTKDLLHDQEEESTDSVK